MWIILTVFFIVLVWFIRWMLKSSAEYDRTIKLLDDMIARYETIVVNTKPSKPYLRRIK